MYENPPGANPEGAGVQEEIKGEGEEKNPSAEGSEEGKTVGDLSPEVYKRDDLTITPEKGGVGPLTVCALFENVIRAAQQTIKA